MRYSSGILRFAGDVVHNASLSNDLVVRHICIISHIVKRVPGVIRCRFAGRRIEQESASKLVTEADGNISTKVIDVESKQETNNFSVCSRPVDSILFHNIDK